MDKDQNILIVLGLIGGSYARALTKQGYRVYAIDCSPSSIEFALKNKIVAGGAVEPTKELVGSADLLIFALYPHTFIAWIERYQDMIKPHALLTDVTGVKGCVVYRVQEMLRDDLEFISAHPMAGRERSGVENSDESVFRGANYIITPTSKNTPSAIERCRELGKVLGFEKISQLSPEEHDEAIAFLSQLTHCIAVSLMTSNDNPNLQFYTGDSFRDLTRIAKINDEMWSELFVLNKDALLREMNAFEREFERLKKAVEEGDKEEMRRMMKKSTERRTLFDK